ncbi:MAG: MarR family transcriptional regulator [Candidatus Aminicenantes bacterium]|nr:MarR family transcriptional regulator [Candidatus Aminicenantes bacterium]
MKEKTHELLDLLQEAAWFFGNRAFDGYCCEGLSFMEYQALVEIRRTENSSIQDVGKAIKFTKSGATRVIDRLERKGYARRQRSSADGRVCCVAITSRGKSVTSKITENYAAYLDDVLKDLDVRSLEMIADALRFLIAAARPPKVASAKSLPSTRRRSFS